MNNYNTLMDQTTASKQSSLPYALERIPFQILPGTSELFSQFLTGEGEAGRFYHSYGIEPSEAAKGVLNRYMTDRSKLSAALREENEKYGSARETFTSIDRLEAPDTVAVMTGQQAGLFTGPLYTIYKAASAIRLAAQLTSEGISAVPVFWIAAEDHDFREVNHISVSGYDGSIDELAYDGARAVENDVPVGSITLNPEIDSVIDRLLGELNGTPFAEDLGAILRSCYRDGEGFADAFGKMIAKLFEGTGLVLVSPLNETIRELSAPTAAEAVRKHSEIREALLKRDAELASAGLHSQVLVGEDLFPFFFIGDENGGGRLPLRLRSEGLIGTADGSLVMPASELADLVSARPTCLSPNALMRPVIQDSVFPTVCYFGGSAEIAYFAQNSVIYEALGRVQPPVRHRSGYSIVDPRNKRTLRKYGYSLPDLFDGRESLEAALAEEVLNPRTAKRLREAEEEVGTILRELQDALAETDPTLSESLSKRSKKVLWHFEVIRRKFRQAEAGRDDTLRKRLDHLFGDLLPCGVVQERVLNIGQFYARFGPSLIEWICESADTDGSEHQVLIL